ncbi:uncharacterized protein EAE98_009331 [Botrytis deweyae]|uniref:F-box domain-containing protein n=1 Tax=Botrytis deweyae TaxID=2478750 RepID=A0ABQ7ICN8_9HELO|nr:uncharacterized protein EAE98_009331 [Botrytis deweyae]KAF7919491.1 hypothetical protein EAE98_009331 [Botrytis deweyae]
MEFESRDTTDRLPSSLLQLLSNTLILYQTTPYLPVSSLLALGATSKSFQELIHETPHVFRYLKLSDVESARSGVGSIDNGGQNWRNVQLDENVTEDDFYGGPLRGIFNHLRRRNLLLDVETLILDGLSVPSDLVSEIILNDSYNVRILSIREVQNLNEGKLRGALKYSCRPSRPNNTPRLQGLYVFGCKDAPQVVKRRRHVNRYPAGIAPIDTIPNYGARSPGTNLGMHWNRRSGDALGESVLRGGGEVGHPEFGNRFPKPIHNDWADTMTYCEGIISFDAVLCKGPRHSASLPSDSPGPWYKHTQNRIDGARVATHLLGDCSGCGTAKNASIFGQSPMVLFPLLSPVPLHVSTAKAAKTPFEGSSSREKLMVRCVDCLRTRYCEACRKWWCEDCFEGTQPISSTSSSPLLPSMVPEVESSKFGVSKSCLFCGLNCHECIQKTQLRCKICNGGYCTVHNEGSTLTTCDWCSRSGRRTRELY